MSFLQNASLYGIIPVINIPRPELAVPLCDALAAGGLPLTVPVPPQSGEEITFRVTGGEARVRRLRYE